MHSKIFHPAVIFLGKVCKLLQKYSLVILTIAVLIIKLLIVNIPNPSAPPEECMDIKSEGCGFIFDEAHYVPAARKLMKGEAANNEHPPLSKFIIVAGMLLFGDRVGNAVGWRIFVAVLGAVSVMMIGLISQELSSKKSVGLVASLLFATDVMSFNLSSIAMLDAPAMTFSLIAVYLTIKKRYVLAGTFMGLSLLCKLSFLSMLGLILVVATTQALRRRTNRLDKLLFLLRNLGKVILPTVVIFLFGLWVYGYMYGAFQTPFDHIKFMLNYHSALKYADSSNVDMPLSWINPISPFKPVPYYIETVSLDSAAYHPVAYWGIYSPLWWSIWLLAPVYIHRLVLNIKRGQSVFGEVLVLSWITFTYLPYFPIAHVLERWVFSFYFYATVPALAIGISRFNEWGDWMTTMLIAIVAAQLVWFFIWFPVKNEFYITILKLLHLPT